MDWYENPDNMIVRVYLKSKAAEWKDIVALDTLNKLVEEQLRTYVTRKDELSQIETFLFL